MFDLVTLTKYVSILEYFGLFVSSITGFIAVSLKFNLCELMIALVVFLNMPILIFLEIINKNKHSLQLLHYTRSYILIVTSLLVMGLSDVGLGFSIFGIMLSIINLLLGVFNCTTPENLKPQNIEEN